MRKRAGRPQRFAAVPNETIDDAWNLDFMAMALLTVLIRHRDGWEITLSAIGEKYGYGREALANAMGLLQVARYVVKVRMMSVEGNNWSTEVYVYDTPASEAEIEALLAQIESDPTVRRAEVIEPTKAAFARAAQRRAKLLSKGRQGPSIAVPRVPENPHSDATCENNASSQVSPECRVPRQSGDPAVFKKTVGKKTNEKTDAPSARSAPDGRRPSTGSRARVMGGGAASGKTSSPLTAEQRRAVQAVRDLLPKDLEQALPARMPRNIADGILAGLATGEPHGRTPEQLVQFRVMPRWNGFWAEKFFAGEITAPLGALQALVTGASRDHDRCDERVDVDTGEPCVSCEMRAQDRRVDQEKARQRPDSAKVVVPGPRPTEKASTSSPDGRDRGTCGDCGDPIFIIGPAVTDGLCSTCRRSYAATH